MSAGDRSRSKVRALADEHGWAVTHDGSGVMQRSGIEIASITVEKDIALVGRVRVRLSWVNGRFSYAATSIAGSARLTYLRGFKAALVAIADPSGGYVPAAVAL